MSESFTPFTHIGILTVAGLHLGFMILEMCLWTRSSGRRIFRLDGDFAGKSRHLAANQGLYNGFLAAGLLWGLFGSGGTDALVFFLGCIVIAGFYGAATVSRAIFFIQAMPALLAMLILFSFH